MKGDTRIYTSFADVLNFY